MVLEAKYHTTEQVLGEHYTPCVQNKVISIWGEKKFSHQKET